MSQALINHLMQFAHENRAELFLDKIEERTNHITLVLEDIYHAQNTSAAIRTCDCFGVQTMHVIENRNEFNVHTGITLGSANWIDIEQYNKKEDNTKECLDTLKKQGYKIVATTPIQETKSLYELDLNQKIALVLGNESEGVSDIVKQEADEFITIPMYGFTESFNISVSAAVCLSELATKLRQSEIDWRMTTNEQQRVLIKWLTHSIKHGDRIIKEFNKLK